MGDDGDRQLSRLFRRRLFSWDRSAGVYRVNLDPAVRASVGHMMSELGALLDEPEAPVLHRLFPPAYSDPAHAEHADEYRRLMMEDLVERQRASAELVSRTLESPTLTEEELQAWSRALNSLRLVLGTSLDITEDDEPGDAGDPRYMAYQLLTWLLDEAIGALSERSS